MYDIFDENAFESENDENLNRKFDYNYQAIKNFYPQVSKLPEDEVAGIVQTMYEKDDNSFDDTKKRTMTYIKGKEPFWKKYLDRLPVSSLEFDGSNLKWVQDGNVTYSWPAMSGKKDYQSRKYQNYADHGPIPEGEWNVNQDRRQHYDDLGYWGKKFSKFGLSAWPGGKDSWGNHRVWLEPRPETDTQGRTNLAIHGGNEFGSAGCIDLENGMDDFNDKYSRYGRDMVLRVKYPEKF